MSKKSKKLGMQMLEEKAMMAGDATAAVVDGNLEIGELTAGQDQHVQVYKLSNGGIRVQGLYGTQIYGSYKGGEGLYNSITFYGIDANDDLLVNLGNGSDTLNVLNYNGGITVDDAVINVGGTDSSIKDHDRVSISGLTTRDELHINTGIHNDQVTVSGSTIGNGSWEDLEIRTGSGADYVSVTTTTVADDLYVRTYDSVAENDDDELNVDSVTADDIRAYMGNGDDEARIQWSTVQDDIYLDMGYHRNESSDPAAHDDDYAYLGFNDVDDITIKGRDGNDEVRFAYNEADDVDFDGGDGFDEFFRWIASNGQDSNDVDDYDLDSAFDRVYGYV